MLLLYSITDLEIQTAYCELDRSGTLRVLPAIFYFYFLDLFIHILCVFCIDNIRLCFKNQHKNLRGETRESEKCKWETKTLNFIYIE